MALNFYQSVREAWRKATGGGCLSWFKHRAHASRRNSNNPQRLEIAGPEHLTNSTTSKESASQPHRPEEPQEQGNEHESNGGASQLTSHVEQTESLSDWDRLSELDKDRHSESARKAVPLETNDLLDDLVPQLKELLKRSAQVRRRHIGVREQTRAVDFSCEDLSDAVHQLQQELNSSSAHTTQDDLATILPLVTTIQQVAHTLEQETDALGQQIESMTRAGQRVQQMETNLFSQPGIGPMLRDNLPTDEGTDSTSSKAATDVSRPRVELITIDLPSVADDEVDDGFSLHGDAPGEVENVYTFGNSRDDLTHGHNTAEATHWLGLSSAVRFSEPLQIDDKDVDGDDDRNIVEEANLDTSFIGGQFEENSGSDIVIAPEDNIEGVDTAILQKREYDFASNPELWPLMHPKDVMNVNFQFDSQISSLSTAHMVSFWILQYFACSWLQFSRYLWNIIKDPVVEEITYWLGLLHLNSLIYVNWYRDTAFTHEPPVSSANASFLKVVDRGNLEVRVHSSGGLLRPESRHYLDMSSTFRTPSNVRQASNMAQKDNDEKTSVRQSHSSWSARDSDHLFDRPKKRWDTGPTEHDGTSLDQFGLPCNNT